MFLNPLEYPITRYLERHHPRIRAELDTLSLDEFKPWRLTGAYQGGWKVFPMVLWNADEHGIADWVRANEKRCPMTTLILQSVPGLILGGFSLLEPGTHIYPHVDPEVPPLFRAHLGLVTPPQNFLRMGDEVRTWEAGKSLIFDGSTLHEAGNLGHEPRIVLIVDMMQTAARAPIADPMLADAAS